MLSYLLAQRGLRPRAQRILAVLSRFLGDYPDCELTGREDLTERLIEAVVDHELDAAVMSTPVDHPALHVQVIGRAPLLVVAPAGLALGDGPGMLKCET